MTRHCTLTFYNAPYIKKGARMLIEDIDRYLTINTIDPYEVATAAYQKHFMRKELIVKMDEKVQVKMLYNYIKIQNQKTANTYEAAVYYWIDNVEPVNTDTVRLYLTMDVINSLGQNHTDVGNPRTFTDKTYIMRQHEDRFVKPIGYDPTAETNYLYRKINRIPENASGPMVKESQRDILQETDENNWYIMYQTQNALDPSDLDNPIDIFFMTDKSIYIELPQPSNTKLKASDLTSGVYYYFLNTTGNEDGTIIVTAAFGGTTLYTFGDNIYDYNYQVSNPAYDYCIFYKSGDKIVVKFYNEDGDLLLELKQFYNIATSIEFIVGATIKTSTTNYGGDTTSEINSAISTTQSVSGSTATALVKGIDSVTRTDSKIMKIVKVPYCPLSYKIVSSAYLFSDANIEVDGSGFLKIKDYDVVLTQSNLNVLLDDLIVTVASPSYYDPISQSNESKLYSSEFTMYKLVYDSFTSQIKLENFVVKTSEQPDDDVYKKIKITFRTSNTMSGVFAFGWETSRGIEYDDEEDFDKYLIVTRNNEMPLFNNDYVNYIRTGYNYDRKQQALSLGLQTLNVASSAATGNVAGAVLQGANMLAGAVNSELSMQKNLKTLASQSTKVSGSNDIDIMSWITNNKLRFIVYKQKNKEMVANFLNMLYNGYVKDSIEKPNVTSRVWWNYLQCTPAFKSEGLDQDHRDWLDELASLYEQGVTVYHVNEVTVGEPEWNLSRSYENWETWILEE